MPNGPCEKGSEPVGSGEGSKPRVVSPRGKVSGESCQGLVKTVKQLQSDVDKLKYAEHKKRELARAIKEREETEEELKAWIAGAGSSRRGTPGNRERHGKDSDVDV